jgi:hypothetical protein
MEVKELIIINEYIVSVMWYILSLSIRIKIIFDVECLHRFNEYIFTC